MSYSYIPPPTSNNSLPAPVLCIRCDKIFNPENPFYMTCPACHQRDVDYTVRLGNQTRILQISVNLFSIHTEMNYTEISKNHKLVLERLVAQLEEEKRELSKNI